MKYYSNITLKATPSDNEHVITIGYGNTNYAYKVHTHTLANITDYVPYSLPTASSETLGGIKVGSGLTISNGVLSAVGYVLPTAAANTLGGIKVGSRLTITDGVLSADVQQYILPTASNTVLGGIKTGGKFSVNGSGVIEYTETPMAVPFATVTGSEIDLLPTVNTYFKAISWHTQFTFDTSGISAISNTIYRFELIIQTGASEYIVQLPSNITWIGDAPTFNETNHVWRIVFETKDGGTSWLASCNADYGV